MQKVKLLPFVLVYYYFPVSHGAYAPDTRLFIVLLLL